MGILSSFLDMANNAINNTLSIEQQKRQWELNEKSANNADARTRALYHDLYSPAAQAKQLQDAGLSLGLMYNKGGVGGSGQAGAQAAPAQFHDMQVMDVLNAQLIEAQIKKTIAEAKNVDKDTEAKDKGMQKTDAEIIDILAGKDLKVLQYQYQTLVNDMAKYDLKFKEETTEYNIETQKYMLKQAIEQANKFAEEAKTAGLENLYLESTMGARITTAIQQVTLNELEMKLKKSSIEINSATIDKIKTDIFNETLQTQILETKTAEELEALKQRVINETKQVLLQEKQLEQNEKRLIFDIVEGSFDIWNDCLRTGTNFLGTAGNLIKKK